MKKLLTIAFFLPTIITAFSQTISLDIKKRHIREFEKMEETNGAKLIPNRGIYFTGKATNPPIKYRTAQDIIPNLTTSYITYSVDSSIQRITYDWEAGKNSNVTDEIFIQSMIAKFDSLERHITDQIGTGEPHGNLTDLHLIKERGGLKKRVNWTTPDSIEVGLHLTLCNWSYSQGGVTIPTSHKIFLSVENKSAAPKISNKTPKEYDIYIQEFLNHLASNNFTAAKNMMDPNVLSIRESIAPDKPLFNEIIKHVDLARGLELQDWETFPGIGGNSSWRLLYRYRDDLRYRPEIVMGALIDSLGKIMMIEFDETE